MRICFIGHDFHRRTGSSAFIVELLRSMADVVEYHADPDGQPARNDALARTLIGSRFDRYVFWQTERIAERLLPFDVGLSFIVPMYDSIAHVPDGFWLKFVKHRFLSFTRFHHEKLQSLGCQTSYFQYFPDAGPEPEQRSAAEARSAFFWERRPDGPVNRTTVLAHCRALGIDALHLHSAPDFACHTGPAAAAGDDVRVTVSHWLASRRDYAALAARPAFFFAPRPLEGIGMATLEAMARGQIVVAPNLPASNEYVAHLNSGLIYEPGPLEAGSRLQPLEPGALARISRAARRKVLEGRRTWLADVERLKSIIADDGRRWSTTDDSASFARVIRLAAHKRISDAV